MRQVNLLRELRYVCKEVGGLAEARRMPTEVRNWWINEITKERESDPGQSQKTGDGRQIVRDVPRGKREG